MWSLLPLCCQLMGVAKAAHGLVSPESGWHGMVWWQL